MLGVEVVDLKVVDADVIVVDTGAVGVGVKIVDILIWSLQNFMFKSKIIPKRECFMF